MNLKERMLIMPLVNTKKMFEDAYKGKYAVGAFNVDILTQCQAVLEAAEECNSPVILSFSSGSRDFFHPGNIKDILLIAAKDIHIPWAIHLDHGKNFEICKACIDEGFTSVMIDASAYDFEENVRITKEVVEYARAHGVTVEGELGPCSKKDDPRFKKYTDPEMVVEFVKRTGVDSLAVSMGTCHGLAKFQPDEVPTLQFDLIEEVEKLLPGFPLVLHGSSSIPDEYLNIFNNYGGELKGTKGVPEELLRQVAQTAVCKINIGTDFRVAFVGGLRKSLSEIKDKFEPRNFLVPAREQCKKLVKEKLSNVFQSSGKVINI